MPLRTAEKRPAWQLARLDMKFGILTQYYPPEMGAPQARLSELAARMTARGHEVFVLTAMPNYPAGRILPGYGGVYRKERKDGCVIHRSLIYPTQKLGLVPRLTSYFSFVFSSLVSGMATLPRLDYLLTESPPLFLGISGYLLSRAKRARWIFNVSDLWPESAVRMGIVSSGPGLSMAWKLEAFCYRKAWMVSGQSQGILADIGRRFPETRRFLLSNGVDTSRFRPELRSEDLRARLAPGKDIIALYAGLHGAAQGLGQVLEAAQRLSSNERVQIVLVGDGPEKAKLRARATEMSLSNVTFLDAMPRQQMPELVASADMAIIPLACHLPGAVPSKIYEAMGSGTPIVLAADGEPADIVAKHECGWVSAAGDSSALAEAIDTLARDSDLRRKLGQNGRQAALTTFNRDAIVGTFMDCLDAEIAGRKAGGSSVVAGGGR